MTIIVTAANETQAELYREQLRHTRNLSWRVIPDPEGHRLGTGGATLHALRTTPLSDRTLIIHAGGQSRRLPEYALTGKLFAPLPGGSVFDHARALLPHLPPGLTVSSGDVVLSFDPVALDWNRPGITGAAIPQPVDVGTRHGVYALGDGGTVYSFLPKPSPAQVRAAGGILPGEKVAVDTGLLHFDPTLSEALVRLAASLQSIPYFDLYQHPSPFPELAALLHGVPFRCSLVEGTFTHIGTTSHLRRIFNGGVVDSILAPGSELGPGALAIECHLTQPIRVGAGSIVHGLTDAAGPVNVAEDTVLHQLQVRLPDGRRGFVLRTYGVEDNPESLWTDEIFPFNNDPAGPYLSLATSNEYADHEALFEARDRRRDANWRASAVALARAETDVRPLLLHAPGIHALAETARALAAEADALENTAPSDAASRHFQASLFFGQAALTEDSARARAASFIAVQKAVAVRSLPAFSPGRTRTLRSPLTIAAPARIDFGGGWSDTPPFCLDWGGAVFNLAVTINGEYPIRTTVSPLTEPVIRLVAADASEVVDSASFRSEPQVGSPFAIHRAALDMLGFMQPGQPLAGLEIRTEVNLPMGSGLGTSSILAATVLKGLLAARGEDATPQELSDLVLALEQFMTTGGGWQDQVGGIYPGAKLTMTGPGPRQRLRVESVPSPPDFSDHFVLYFTGIRRIAKNLLEQVVGRYLAREVQAVQVLHSIKTLAVEMAYAMRESDWHYFGSLLDRHWKLNQILDPHTTNAPIDSLLEQVRPFISGAKLAGAGGGGFLMLMAKSPDDTRRLRRLLSSLPGPGALCEWSVAPKGLHD